LALFSTFKRDNNLSSNISNTATFTINHDLLLAICTAVERFCLRQLDFLVISADSSL